MKIVVIGGSGLIDSKTVAIDRGLGGPSTTHGIENETVSPRPLLNRDIQSASDKSDF